MEYRLGSSDEFWRLTPRLLRLALRGAWRAEATAQKGRAWLAWHVVALGRMKRLIPLRKLMGERASQAKQTLGQAMAFLARWQSVTPPRAEPGAVPTPASDRVRRRMAEKP